MPRKSIPPRSTLSPEEREALKVRDREARLRYKARHPERLQQQWRAKHARRHAKELLSGKRYRARNKDVILAKNKARYRANIEENRAKDRARYAARHAEELLRHREYNAKYPDRLLEAHRKWAKAHPENIRAAGVRRRASKRNVPINDFTAAQWCALCKAAAYLCCYCGKKFPSTQLQPDHLTPYVKQGSNTLHNVLPCCGSCNSRKKDRAVLKPVQPFLLLPEDAAD
jgi:5-methylcytosine-specific restriction endonuclease McrA